MSSRLLSVLIGYLFGCFLTAEAVVRMNTGKSAFAVGSGNPGMANMAKIFGLKWAAVTLLGDVLKTVVPCMLCRYVLFPSLGQTAILYAGVGAALGHGFPFWHRFRGGRSVAVTCTYLILFSPVHGAVVELAGLLVVMASGYLALGALAIPCLYLIPLFRNYSLEAALVAVAGTALLFFLHRDSLYRIAAGKEKRVDLLAGFRRR